MVANMLDFIDSWSQMGELQENFMKGSKFSAISAYFTVYASAELKKELSKIDKIQFIFTEPTFVKKR